MGVEHICAVDGNEQRLEFAKRMGANTTVNFMNYQGVEALAAAVEEAQGGHLADFASSAQETRRHMQTFINSSATAAASVSLASLSTAETQ